MASSTAGNIQNLDDNDLNHEVAEPLPATGRESPANILPTSLLVHPMASHHDAVRARNFEGISQEHAKAPDPVMESSQKRPKLHHHFDASREDESKARFRPYQETRWQQQFNKLVDFKLRYGHCCVPHTYPENQVLSRWVKRQRYQ